MNTVFATATVIFAASISATLLPIRARISVGLTSILNFSLATLGIIAGAMRIAGAESATILIHFGSGWMTLNYSLSHLGALFLVLLSFVSATAVVYGAAQPHADKLVSSKVARSTFIFSMMTVVAAGNALSFTIGWELMTISSALLVVTEVKKHPSARSALIWYLTMSQVSAIALILGFSSLSSNKTLGSSLWWPSLLTFEHKPISTLGIGLLLLAFGIKMGLLPVHVWLAKAHPAAPAEISALMSGAMVAMGVYGLLLTVTQLDQSLNLIWGEVLIIVGAATSVYSIIKAAVEDDLKVLLAKSTSENMGLIAIAIGTYICALRSHENYVAHCALLAAILLTFAHAFFKQSLFMAAGSIYHSSNTKMINELGGIATRMRLTTATFALGAVGATALPPTLTFVAEWLLLQTLSHASSVNAKVSIALKILFPIAVAAIALTTGLAVVTFTKIIGVALLGIPRSRTASEAREVPPAVRIGPLVASIAIFAPALLIGLVARILDHVLFLKLSIKSTSIFTLELPVFRASITPIAIVGIFLGVVVIIWLCSKLLTRKAPNQTVEIPWGCGLVADDPTFQTSASGFTEPVLRIFDDVINPGRDIEVSHGSESTYLSQRHLRASLTSNDFFEERLMRPIISTAERTSSRMRAIQSGSIHLYLMYAFVGLISVIVLSSL